MDKLTFAIIGTLVKFVFTFGGLLYTLILLVTYLAKKDRSKLRKAGLVFVITAGALIIFHIIEFAILASIRSV